MCVCVVSIHSIPTISIKLKWCRSPKKPSLPHFIRRSKILWNCVRVSLSLQCLLLLSFERRYTTSKCSTPFPTACIIFTVNLASIKKKSENYSPAPAQPPPPPIANVREKETRLKKKTQRRMKRFIFTFKKRKKNSCCHKSDTVVA